MSRFSLLARWSAALACVLLFLAARPVRADSPPARPVADSFDFPIDDPSRTIGFDLHPGLWQGTCFGVNISAMWHAGEDWFAPAGTPVRAVANGTVVYVQPDDIDYPGGAIIVEHVLPSGDKVYSMYGHLQQPVEVKEGQTVALGDTLGYVLYQRYGWMNNSHLHWEVRNFMNAAFCGTNVVAGPGYTYPDHPEDDGYFDPSDFVAERRILFATIGGQVKSGRSGAPVAGARVVVQAGELLLTAITDEYGGYKVDEVPVGEVKLMVSKGPYEGIASAKLDVAPQPTQEVPEVTLTCPPALCPAWTTWKVPPSAMSRRNSPQALLSVARTERLQ